MPGGDRTGPWGQGAMSGRGAGFCGGYGTPGYMNPYPGRYFGRGYGGGYGGGFGRGRGFRGRAAVPVYPYPYSVPYSTQNEAEMLQQEAQHLETSLEEIKKRLSQLEEQSQKDKK
jgi:hypothetical protein